MACVSNSDVCAAIPNFRVAGDFVNFREACGAVAAAPIEVKDGWVESPTAPGLGVALDVARLRAHPFKEFPSRATNGRPGGVPSQGLRAIAAEVAAQATRV